MQTTRFLFILLLCIYNFGKNYLAHAGNEGPNGGDGIALEIKLIGETLVTRLNENPGLITSEKLKELNELIYNPQFVVHTMEHPLYIAGERKDAINEIIDGAPEIRVNVKYWTNFHPIIRTVLVAHELFCLIGLERTDYYQISTHVVVTLYRGQYLSQDWSEGEIRQAEGLIVQFQQDLNSSDRNAKNESDIIKQIKALNFNLIGQSWPIF